MRLLSGKGPTGRAAVKESIDNLPMGLCFSDYRGIVLLCNRCMQHLAYAVTGMDLQDPEAFWNAVTCGRLAVGAQRVPYGGAAVIALSEGTVWAFFRRELTVDGQAVSQFLASNITELDLARTQLHEANALLRDMNERLRKYGKDMTLVTAQEERLATKMRIHDELGGTLLATRHYLTGGSGDPADILSRWRQNIHLLRSGAEDVPRTNLDVLCNAAKALGVSLRMTGPLPEEREVRELLLSAVGEALNNAVRHGGAKNLEAVFSLDNGAVVSVTNDGALPEEPIAEGGGLSALRRKAEQRGGSLELTVAPRFCLKVCIPLKQKERKP